MHNLSSYELSIMQDPEILLAKNRIIEKIAAMFASLSHSYRQLVESLPEDVPATFSPKISKGEKYEGLPYLVLDYPRLFSSNHIFAVRTLFWWGNYFSVTLHLQGIYQQQFAPKIQQAIENKSLEEWYVQYQGNMWQHAISIDFQLVKHSGVIDLGDKPFIKLIKKIPLQEWDSIEKIFVTEYAKIFEMLYAPMR